MKNEMKTLLLLGAGLLVLSAAALAQENWTGKEAETWIDEMREHFSIMHPGQSFEEHHETVHGNNWEQIVGSCHGAGQAGNAAGYRGYGISSGMMRRA